MNNRCVLYPALIAAIVLSATASASITGSVTDTTGSPVSGALVTFIDESDSDNEYSGYTDVDGMFEAAISPLSVNEVSPSGYQLNQNYPNPFNPSTKISFSLNKAGFVNLSVYNVTGQKIKTLVDNYLSSGSHTITWHGTGDEGKKLAAGIYIYRFKSDDHIESKKMLLIDGGNVNFTPVRDHYHGLSAASILFKPATEVENTSYSVKITGNDIVVYEQNGVNTHETESLDFVVKRLPESLTLISIPGGTFQMGDIENAGLYFEDPVHEVTQAHFEMSRTEITNAQYTAYLNEMMALDYIFVNIHGYVYRKTDDWSGERFIYVGLKGNSANVCGIGYRDSTNMFYLVSGRENWPVVSVTWHGAKAFAVYYGLELPAEEEWEYAARGGKQLKYATEDGHIHKSKVNYYDSNLNPHPVAVGSFPPNPFGLYDMSGNAAEWCNDRFTGDYTGVDIHPPDYISRIYRGGSWFDNVDKCRTAYRFGWPPEHSDSTLGFRVARRQ